MNTPHTASPSPSCEGAQLPFLRMPKVVRMIGLGRSTVYRMIAPKEFPCAVRVGKRAVAWRTTDLDRWSANRPSTTH